MTDHRSELRRQLMDAAARRTRAAPEPDPEQSGTVPTDRFGPGRRWPRVVAAAAVITVVAAVAVGVVATDADPVAADTFDVERDGEDLVIDVVGRVEDPDDAARELRAYGQDVELIGVPAAPTIVGDIVSATAERTEPQVTIRDGRVETIRISRTAPGVLTIRYGREAKSGEAFEATEAIPKCGSYAGETVTRQRVDRIARAHGPQVRWQQVGGDGPAAVRESDLDDDATFVDIFPLSDDTVMVLVTDGTPPPPGMTC